MLISREVFTVPYQPALFESIIFRTSLSVGCLSYLEGTLNLHSLHTVYPLYNHMSISGNFFLGTKCDRVLSQSVSFTHETGADWIFYPEFP